MATSPDTIRFVQDSLRSPRFRLKAMFGEYALYADDVVVALVCDDRVFVKVHPATAGLEGADLAPPYPGAKPHYVAEEGQLGQPDFGQMLLALAKDLKAAKAPKKAKAKTKPKSSR